uniref:BAH domain-containing protein n=1 Tax=Leersia perrieri TaxID=77586 RepID=A0A0D9X1B3_9ORYZ
MAKEDDGPEFVRWREDFVSQERGSRVVHYYLEDTAGVSHLAVVGTERSLRHMLYVVSEDFREAQGCGGGGVDGNGGSGVLARKWRSRREVVDWLASFLPAKSLASKLSKFGPHMAHDIGLDGYREPDSFMCHNLGKAYGSDIMWSGSSWYCGKQLCHYKSFSRNGTTISTHSFVLVMSEEESRYLAYLEDMYEDKKGQKKVKVRWFHQNQEFACAIPPPPPHPCEVFITPYSQVISVECVDDIATVLTPEHYEKCANTLANSSMVGIRFCFRQYSKNKFKRFDLRTLRGYFSQAVVLSLKLPPEQEKDVGSDIIKTAEHCTPGKTKFPKQFERLYSKCLGTKICRGPQEDSIASYQKPNSKQSPRKHLSVKFIGPQNQHMPTYNIGDRIEVLSQDSGIVGCWFRCTVLKSCPNHNKLKVQYDDLQNADDSGRLEEWVPASTLARPDKLGLRCPERFRVRPRPQQNSLVDGINLLPGTAVDIWQFSGWWEGVLVSADNISADSLQIYFPGENFFSVCQLKNLRISKDWVKNRWIDIEMKPDVLSKIPSVGVQTRQPDNVTSVGKPDSGSSAMSDQELVALQTNSSGDKQTGADQPAEVSLTDTASAFAEYEKQTVLGKRPRDDDDAEHDCNGEVGVDVGKL